MNLFTRPTIIKSPTDSDKVMYEGVDIAWDLMLHGDVNLNNPITLLEKEAGTFYAKLARNRMYIEDEDNIYGKRWMACLPKMFNGLKEQSELQKRTKYSFYYWLNYGDGCIYGVFTVEEIQEWLEQDNVTLDKFPGANIEYTEMLAELKETRKDLPANPKSQRIQPTDKAVKSVYNKIVGFLKTVKDAKDKDNYDKVHELNNYCKMITGEN